MVQLEEFSIKEKSHSYIDQHWVTAVAHFWVTAVARWLKTPDIHCYVAGSIPAVTPRYSSNKARNALWSTKKQKNENIYQHTRMSQVTVAEIYKLRRQRNNKT